MVSMAQQTVLLTLCLVNCGEKAREEECRACQNVVLKLASEYTLHMFLLTTPEKKCFLHELE